MIIENYDEMKQHIVDLYPQEAVGIIYNNKFYKLENVHCDPLYFFKVDHKEIEPFLDKDIILIHSHTQDYWPIGFDPRTPSYEDMQCQEAMAVPFGIVHCDGESITPILYIETGEIPELLGRNYISNVTDCFTLARDYYRLKFNIDFGTHPRPANWEKWNPHYIEQNYKNLGFVEIDANEVTTDDIILFRIGSNYINHIAIAINDTTFIHHLYNRKSCEDRIDKWHRQIVKYLRFQGQKNE